MFLQSSQVDEALAQFYIEESLVPQYILLGLIVILIAVGGGLLIGAIITFIIVKSDQSKVQNEKVIFT